MVSLSVAEPAPAIQEVLLSDVDSGTFTLRVMAAAVGGEIDAETTEIDIGADANAVATALQSASGTLGVVAVTKTIDGELAPPPISRLWTSLVSVTSDELRYIRMASCTAMQFIQHSAQRVLL